MTGEELLTRAKDDIVLGYRMDVLATEKRVFDFLPIITVGSRAEEKILNSWAFFFISKKVPFIVTQTGKRKTLWKGLIVTWKPEE